MFFIKKTTWLQTHILQAEETHQGTLENMCHFALYKE